MILTEDKIYTMSLETESVNRYLWNADPETDSCISGEETF